MCQRGVLHIAHGSTRRWAASSAPAGESSSALFRAARRRRSGEWRELREAAAA
jgi:hypothetical protein